MRLGASEKNAARCKREGCVTMCKPDVQDGETKMDMET